MMNKRKITLSLDEDLYNYVKNYAKPSSFIESLVKLEMEIGFGKEEPDISLLDGRIESICRRICKEVCKDMIETYLQELNNSLKNKEFFFSINEENREKQLQQRQEDFSLENISESVLEKSLAMFDFEDDDE